VVTGAGSGIGAAFAIELAKRGGRVVCSDIDEVAAKRTVSAITDHGGEAVAIACDVTQLSDVHELAAQSQSWFGAAPTLVINNAGVGSGGAPIGELPIEDWQWVLSINLWGPIHGCHVFAPILRSAEPSDIPRGIINVASAAAFGAAPSMAAYNVSKAGALSLSETLAAELSGTGIKVTALCPTFVKTNILESGRISTEANQFATKSCAGPGSRRTKVARAPAWTPTNRGDLYIACRNWKPRSAGNIKRTGPWHLHPRHRPGVQGFPDVRTPIQRRTLVAIDMEVMLAKIKDRQWALADIDWDAPGAETISDEQRPQLKAFMADLCWIENIGARGFARWRRKHPHRPSPRSIATSTPRSSGTPTPNWR